MQARISTGSGTGESSWKRKRASLAYPCLALMLAAAGCSSKSFMRPDCHSCTVEEQEWQSFSWSGLVGRWKGSVERLHNEQAAARRKKTDVAAELSFVKASALLRAWGGECKGLPADSLVLNGLLWEGGSRGAKEYEAFVPVDEDRVAYGRVVFDRRDGGGDCRFHRLGRVMSKNRLNLPAVTFSDRAVTGARSPASPRGEQETSVEFLRYAAGEKATQAFAAGGRRPAAVKEQERPPLILRVFRISAKTGTDRGEWSDTEEYIYRLWKTE